MQSEFEPKPSGKATKFYIHLSNLGEFLSWMSAGIAISFLVQLIPKFLLLYPLGFILSIAYFASNIPHNPTASILRIVAIVASLVGFWEVFWLHRDSISAVFIVVVAVVLVGAFWVWQRTR